MIPRRYCQPTRAGAGAGEAAAPGATQPEPLQPDHQAALDRYARCLQARQCSPHTLRLYVGAVERWLRAGGVPGHLDERLASNWLAALRERCATSTVNLHIKALRSFYRWQADIGEARHIDHMRLPKMRKPPERVVRFFTAEQLGQVLAMLPLHTFAGQRDYAILRTLFETGLRATEMATLELGSILDDNTLFVRGKGRRDRYVPITAELRDVLDAYIRRRREVRPGKAVALWYTRSGKPLANGRSIWEIVQRRLWAELGRQGGWHAVARAAKPWRGQYPHLLRASFATALLKNGCPLTVIAQLMGHADVSTTAHYLGADLEQLRQAMAHHPRAKRLAPEPDHAPASAAIDTPTAPADRPATPAPGSPSETAAPSSTS